MPQPPKATGIAPPTNPPIIILREIIGIIFSETTSKSKFTVQPTEEVCVHGRIAGHHDSLQRRSAHARALADTIEALHVEGMRGFAVLASVVLPAVLIACTEPVEPNFASAPAFYEPAFGPWWPYCCTPVFVGPVRFRHFHQFQHFQHHHHHGGGGHHGGGHR